MPAKINGMLKDFWGSKIRLDWRFGILLILFFGLTRFSAVLYGIQTGDNKYVSIVFLAMIVLPFVLLSTEGKLKAKFKKPNSIFSLFKSFLLGGIICLLVFAVGQVLYSNSSINWFKYIGENYPINFETVTKEDKTIYFIIFLIIGTTFSPFGEELLYRGVIHASFVNKFGEYKSAIIDSLAFGLVHLAHYGILYQNSTWDFHFLPSVLWVAMMFSTGLLFNYCKRMSDSIWGAIISHMAFNITMTYLIFYHLF